MNEQRFRYVWKLLCKTWKENGHCMRYGSGRDTLAYWVNVTNKENIPKWVYRDALNEAVKRGWAKMERTSGDCTKFFIGL